MKQTLKKYLTRPACLVLAIALLGSAVAVASLNGSPYDLAKKAAFALLEQDNLTMSLSLKAYLNGELMEQESGGIAMGNGKTLNWSGDRRNGEESIHYNYSKNTGDGHISTSFRVGDLTTEGIIATNRNTAYYYPAAANETGSLMDQMFGGQSRNSSYVRLAEVLLDTMVGDIKNNMSSGSDGDGNRTVSLSLTAAQIPELYNLALSFLQSETSRYSYPAGLATEPWVYGGAPERVYDTVRLDGHEKIITTYRGTVTEWYSEVYNEAENCWYVYYEGDAEFDAQNAQPNIMNEFVSETRTIATAEDYGDLDSQPVKSAFIDYASGHLTLDKQNRPTAAHGYLRLQVQTIFDEWYELVIEIDFAASDFGTTDPVCPIANFDEIFTVELFDRYYSDDQLYSRYLEYSLDAHGRILPDSIADGFTARYW